MGLVLESGTSYHLGQRGEWLGRHCRETYNLEVELDLDPTVNPPFEAIRDLLFDSARELLFAHICEARGRRPVRAGGREPCTL